MSVPATVHPGQSEPPLRVALVGAGWAGQIHADAYAELPSTYELVAVVDTDPAAAEVLAARVGTRSFAGSIGELLELLAVDVVDVCTPPFQHGDDVVAALGSGAHVICEKPLVSRSAELVAIRALAEEVGRSVFPVYQLRSEPRARWLRDEIIEGRAGTPLTASISLALHRGSSYFERAWRADPDKAFGGVLATQCIHDLDLLTMCFGEVDEVNARTGGGADGSVEATATAMLTFANGAVGSITATTSAAVESADLRIECTGLAARRRFGQDTGGAVRWALLGPEGPVGPGEPGPGAPSTFAAHLQSVADALRGRADAVADLDVAERSLALLGALYRSAAVREPVQLPTAGWCLATTSG